MNFPKSTSKIVTVDFFYILLYFLMRMCLHLYVLGTGHLISYFWRVKVNARSAEMFLKMTLPTNCVFVKQKLQRKQLDSPVALNDGFCFSPCCMFDLFGSFTLFLFCLKQCLPAWLWLIQHMLCRPTDFEPAAILRPLLPGCWSYRYRATTSP